MIEEYSFDSIAETPDMRPLRDDFLSNIQRVTGLTTKGRKVCITPIDGAYGLAGYMLIVEGSPPKGAVLILTSSAENDLSFTLVFQDGKARRIGEKSPLALSAKAILEGFDLPLHSGAEVQNLISISGES